MNRYTKEDAFSYTLGMSLSIELLKCHADCVRKVILSSKASRNMQLDQLLISCKENQIETIYDDALIDHLSAKENCYCIAVFEKYDTELKSDRHILLHGFEDFGDLGTVLRSAVSFDFSDIILIDSALDYFDPRCIRASMGSIFHCNLNTFKDFSAYLNQYPDHQIYPFAADKGIELKEIQFKKPYSLLISQKEQELLKEFQYCYYVKHQDAEKLSISILSSVVFSEAYYQNLKR